MYDIDKHVMLIGDTGVGKTVVAQDFMEQENAANDGGGTAVPITIVLSAQTTSRNMQDIFEGKLEKKRKNLLGAPVGQPSLISSSFPYHSYQSC